VAPPTLSTILPGTQYTRDVKLSVRLPKPLVKMPWLGHRRLYVASGADQRVIVDCWQYGRKAAYEGTSAMME
jgi:hypothetical protein